jgi:ArsR family transcriptional regulator
VTQSDFHALTRYFKALSDRVRLQMLRALSTAGEINVSDLAERLDVSQPLVSWHLRPLVRAGLVRVRKAGRESYCSLNPDAFQFYESAVSSLLSRGEGTGADHDRVSS